MRCESAEEIRQPLHFGIEPATKEKGVSVQLYVISYYKMGQGGINAAHA